MQTTHGLFLPVTLPLQLAVGWGTSDNVPQAQKKRRAERVQSDRLPQLPAVSGLCT